jgi:hypothetical protein
MVQSLGGGRMLSRDSNVQAESTEEIDAIMSSLRDRGFINFYGTPFSHSYPRVPMVLIAAHFQHVHERTSQSPSWWPRKPANQIS